MIKNAYSMALDEDEKQLLEKLHSKVGNTRKPFAKVELAKELQWEMNRLDFAMIELIQSRIIENVDNGGRWSFTFEYLKESIDKTRHSDD